MEHYKVVIVDDDEVSAENLRRELRRDERFELGGVAGTGRQGKKLIAKVDPDLLFLDVELPDTTGMELLQEIRSMGGWNGKVVFYTAYDKYMIQAIRGAAFDYLLKPFETDALCEILARYIAQEEELDSNAAHAKSAVSATAPQTFIVFTPTNDMRALRPSEIGFFRYCSDRKQWEVVINNQLPLALPRGTTAGQIIRYAPNFVQIHQSYIINIDYLMIIKDGVCRLYPPFDQVTELQVSRKYKRELQERFCM